MSSPARSRSLLQSLLFIMMIVPPVVFVAALPWLRQQSQGLVLLVTGVAATLTVVTSIALAILYDRTIDEWQRSNARFSTQWGWTIGGGVLALILILPPVRDLIISGAAIWGGTSNPDARLVITTFTFGFMATVLAQALCTILLSLAWGVWMSRAPRDPS